MTTYNTGNPVGSTDARDLYDNAQALDQLVNGSGTYANRLGVQRRTLAGIDAEAVSRMDAIDTAALTQRTDIQSAADVVLRGIGYAPPVAYAAGISLTMQTQTVEYNGDVYAPKVGSLPFTTNGTFETSKFRLIQGLSAADLAGSGGAAMAGFMPKGIGAVATTVEKKLQETVSLTDHGGIGDGVSDNSVAVQKAEEVSDFIYLPDGNFLVKYTGPLTKRYWGPGNLIYSGAGEITFTGSGLNDLTIGGDFVQSQPLQVVVKINASGSPDTLAYSLNGGIVFYNTIEVYNPITDQVTAEPINITAGPVALQGTGVTLQFASTTGHTAGDSWSFTLAPHPKVLDTQSGLVTKYGKPIMGVLGVLETNTFLGKDVFGNKNNAGNQNTAVGYRAMYSNVTGYANTAVGITALTSVTTGFNNTGIGADALYSLTTGINNVGVGIYSGRHIISGEGNVGIGSDSNGYQTTGSNNTALGTQTLYHNRTGDQNVAVGSYALRGGSESLSNGKSVNYSTAVGVRALHFCYSGFNTAYGHESLYNVTSGAYNAAIGSGSGFRLTTGSYNFFAGHGAGANVLQAADVLNCVAIGDGAFTRGGNAIAIGSGVSAEENQIVIGNSLHLNAYFYGNINTQLDSTFDIGSAIGRFKTVYATTGAINTSDEREKQQIKPIDAAALRAWAKVEYCQFKFNDAVESKGAGARWHFGVIAQRVKEAFESEGLNAFEYGVLCYDEWDDQYQDEQIKESFVDADGVEKTRIVSTGNMLLKQAAGNRYGIRYEEALALECAYLRSRLAA